MDFKDELLTLGKSVEELKNYMTTEEATKNALIVPFIKILGYNVFDPREVRPEYVCDIGIKKGEKIDFALFSDNKDEPLILIECKQWSKNLILHESQLVRYFNVSKSKFGLLTNGIIYRFYTDLENQNIMDEVPFLEINITDIKDSQIEELKKFHKNNFNFSAIIDAAKNLKYLRLFREKMQEEFSNPSPELVKHFLTKIDYTKPKTPDRIISFTALLKNSFDSYIAERVNKNLQKAMENENEQPQIIDQISDKGIITTKLEMEAFGIIKAILGIKIAVNRIIYKDTKNYFAINYDKSTQPICRLYFNSNKKIIGIMNGKTNESNTKLDDRYEITSLEDIYKYSNQLLDTISLYDKDLSETPTSSDNIVVSDNVTNDN